MYATTYFFILLLLSVKVNSPQPDVICAILIIYLAILFIEQKVNNEITHYTLFAILVALLITFKLSALLMVGLVIPVILKEFSWRKFWVISGVGIVAVLPFFIRNYYLSGYLVYPFPALDLFDVDWKIPLKQVIIEKSKVESWGKIPHADFKKILAMPLQEWIGPWFSAKTPIQQKLIVLSGVMPFTIPLAIWKKKYGLVLVQSIIFINLVFWFYQSPNFRFALGF